MNAYRLTSQAEQDLTEISAYIAEDSIESAIRVVGRFHDTFEFLAANPEIGHLRQDLTTHPFRFFSLYSYVIIYKPDHAGITRPQCTTVNFLVSVSSTPSALTFNVAR